MPACELYQNMFNGQNALTSAAALFQFTSNLTGQVGQNMFINSLGTLQNANAMFCSCNITEIQPGFLNRGSTNKVLRNVGCIFHNNSNATGSSPAFWDGSLFTNIQQTTDGFYYALGNATRLSNYATAQAVNGNWVATRAH
jgi:hypothetical protein